MWVAKNKGERARPSLFYHKPSRLNDHEWYAHGSDYGYPLYDEHQFDSLTWEDEPIEIKLVPAGFSLIEVPPKSDISKAADEFVEQSDYAHPDYDSFIEGVEFLKSKIVE